MMLFSYPYLETGIELSCENPFVLVVEDPGEFYKIVDGFFRAYKGEDSPVKLWDGDKPMQCGVSCEILLDYFNFEFSDKKIINPLYKKLQRDFQDENFFLKLNEINAKIGCFFQDLFFCSGLSLDYEELSVEGLLKACSVKPEKTYEGIAEKIICYIDIFIEIKNIRIFIFVNLKSVLSDNDLKDLYHHCHLREVPLLLIESGATRTFFDNEKVVIVTDDLCEIVAHVPE